MSEWRQLVGYCGACATWSAAVPHVACGRDPVASAISLDPEEFLLTCDQCHEVWLIEATQLICPACGHNQPVEMRDDPVELHLDDRVLGADGPVVYVLLRSGALMITHRSCISA